MLETHRLAEDGELVAAAVNLVLSVVAGVLVAELGRLIGGAPVNQDCLKLTTYFGERDRVGKRLLADELLDVYGGHRLQASILLRGTEGFGRLHHLHTDRLLSLSEDLPAVSVAVDTRERIESLLGAVLERTHKGLVTLERARLLSGDADLVSPPDKLDDATKLTALRRAPGASRKAGRRSSPSATCCTGEAWRGRRCCSGSTGPGSGTGSGPPSSGATPRCR